MGGNVKQRLGNQDGLLRGLRQGRRTPAALLALLCYLFVGAIVPPGHMAAPLHSGSAFHLCHGDLRSAWIADALATSRPDHQIAPSSPLAHAQHSAAGSDAFHHPHSAHHEPATVTADQAVGFTVEQSSADPGCSFASTGSDLSATSLWVSQADALAFATPQVRQQSFTIRRSWLRPPARSPPQL